MNYIILDLEWNQSASGKVNSLPDMPFEIIEIGAVKLDEKLRYKGEWRRVIKPKVYKKLQSAVRKVIHLTETDLERGDDFEDAIVEFLDWCGEEYTFAIWGSMDLTELQRNMKHYNVANPFPKPFIYLDVQKLYSHMFLDGKNKVNLKSAIQELKIRETEEYHSALSDAHYTAKVLQKIDLKKVGRYTSIDTYLIPNTRREEIYQNYGEYEKYISRGFDTRERAAEDRIVRSCNCITCGKQMRRKIKWFATNSKVYYGLFECPEHGLIKGRFRTKQADNGQYYAIRIMKKTDIAGAQKIKDKQIKEREHKRLKRQAERRNALKKAEKK